MFFNATQTEIEVISGKTNKVAGIHEATNMIQSFKCHKPHYNTIHKFW